MPNNTLDKAIAAVPKFGERINFVDLLRTSAITKRAWMALGLASVGLFTKKLLLAQYADSTIYDYRLKISQAVLYLNKLPDIFTQEDIDEYLSMLLDRNRYSM